MITSKIQTEWQEEMESILEDVLSCIRDGWAGWAGIFARDAARAAFTKYPRLRRMQCPECDAPIIGREGSELTLSDGEDESFHTVVLCDACARWFR